MTRYSRQDAVQLELFEEEILTPLSRWTQCMAEIEQEEMRLRGRLDRFRVAIRTAQRRIEELREAQMQGFQYPYRRR
jgi:hypothetical protein